MTGCVSAFAVRFCELPHQNHGSPGSLQHLLRLRRHSDIVSASGETPQPTPTNGPHSFHSFSP